MKTLASKFKYSFIFFLFVFLSGYTWGQVQIYLLDFETSGGYTTSMTEQTDNSKDYFTRTDGTDISATYNSPQDSYFFAAQDLDADGMSSPATLTIDDINISGYTNLELRVYLAEDDASDGNNDWDDEDFLHIDYDIDNTSTFTNGIWVENDGSTYNTAPYIDTNYDGNGEGTEITDNFAQFTKSISGTGSLIDIQVTFGGLTSSDEDIAIDHIEIWGTSSNDADSQVSASSTLTEPATISSTVTTSTGLQVFDFTFTDLGSGDGVATIIDQLQITRGSNNGVANWTDAIAGAVLNGPDLTNMTGTINATNITFASNDMISISDGNNETYTLSIWLKTDLSAIPDNDILEFAMNYNDITTDANGSFFGSGAPESGDTNIAIDIDVTKLLFVEQPSNTNVNVAMSPDPTVKACDTNGNIDMDYSSAVSVSSSGTMSGDPVSGTWSNGLATFSNLTHTTVGTGLILTASSGSFTVYSESFDIADINACGLEEFDNGTTEPTGWIFTNIGATYATPGNYGNSSPSLKMDNTGDIVETATVTSPSQLTFWIKGQTTDANSALLVEGWDGSWNTIENITNLPTTGTTKTYNSGLSSYSKFRFSYTKSQGNLAFDDVDITCGNCDEPSIDANSVSFASVATTSMTVDWTNGNGSNRIVVAKANAAVDWTPTDNNTYAANASFGSGTELGTGNYVVYNGSNNTVDITNLIPGTTYYFKIFEYGCSGGAEDYLTSGTPAEGNETTLPANVTNFTVTCITKTTATITWTLPQGDFDGILITARESNLAPSDPNCDGSTLTSPVTDFSTAPEYCSNGTNSKYVYNATGTTVTITGLTPNADYVFKAFTYKNDLWSSGTQSAQVAEISDVTDEDASPFNQQITVAWTNPTTCYDEIMVVAKEGGSVSSNPSGNGSSYTADANYGSGTLFETNAYVVYKGTGTSVDVTSLNNGTQYCFKIFVRKDDEWSNGIEVCEIPDDVTIFQPGELVIVGYDSNVSFGKDTIFITSLVDIKPGTEFLYVNSRFEAGAPANVRTNEWHGGGDDPNADPGIFKILYSSAAAGNIPAGSIIAFGTSGYTADNIRVNGTLNTDFSSTNISGSANIHATAGDQIWLLQGTFTDQGNYHTLDGNVLWGLTNNIDWVPIDQPVSDASDGSGRESRLHPDLECFNMEYPSGKGWAFYENQANHNDTKRNLLLAIMNTGNWQDGVGDNTMNFHADYTSPYGNDTIGKPFTITAGNSDGTWVGGASGNVDDWFDCRNWEGLTVPDEQMNVIIPNVTNSPKIDHVSSYAPKYEYFAECNDMQIDDALNIYGSAKDTLFVHGNLLILNSGLLNMDDNNSSTTDGLLYLSGDWNNQGTFNEGNGTVVFNGEDVQGITGSSTTETFNNLRINNINLDGVITDPNLIINDTLSQLNSLLNLNGHNIELKGVYENTNSYFEGDVGSYFVISSDSDNGEIDSIYFKNDLSVYDFSIDRAGRNAILMTDLNITNNLTITAGSVILTPGKNYDVGGTITNTLGTAGALVLKSDASGTASLIQNSGAVPATVERYLTGNNWHYLFAPLTQTDTATFITTPIGENNPNFYWYNETAADFWQGHTIYNPTGWSHANTISSPYMQNDRGYIHRYLQNYIYSQTGGNLTDADKDFTLSYTNSGTGSEPTTGTNWDNFEGWNLFGNPYVSAIDWDNSGINKSGIENYIYYYDDTQSKYLCYGGNPPWDNNGVTINGGTQYIPAGQGFFVKANSNAEGSTFTIPKTARVHSAQAFYKKDTSNIKNLIKLNIQKDNYTDETVIRTLPPETNVTEEHDGNYDAYKMFAWDNTKPQLYSKNNENTYYYAVNSLPEFSENKIIHLGVFVGETGVYKINMTENYFENTHIWLEDRSLETNTDLLDISSYTFNQSAETNDNRFYLHLQKNTNPVLNAKIPDQEIAANEYYSYNLPEYLFIDKDFGDELKLSATLENGDNLPEWLNFNSETGYFSGTPAEIQTIKIKVTATDMFGESVFDVYKLTVSSASFIQEIGNNDISVYPNPSEGKFVIEFMKPVSGVYMINDISGKILIVDKIKSNRAEVDLSRFGKGIYIISIKTENGIIKRRVVLK